MQDDVEQKRVAGQAALKRRRGMSDAQRAQLTRHFESQSDLYTQCSRCGETLRGTLTELKAHTCGL